jgi:hypothetical protein
MEAQAIAEPDLEPDPDEPLVLGALEPDQLAAAKSRYGRRRLNGVTRALMWGLRLYVLLTMVVVADRIAQTVVGR